MEIFDGILDSEQTNIILTCSLLTLEERLLYLVLCRYSSGFGVGCSISRVYLMKCLNFTDYRNLGMSIDGLIKKKLIRSIEGGRYEFSYEIINLDDTKIFEQDDLISSLLDVSTKIENDNYQRLIKAYIDSDLFEKVNNSYSIKDYMTELNNFFNVPVKQEKAKGRNFKNSTPVIPNPMSLPDDLKRLSDGKREKSKGLSQFMNHNSMPLDEWRTEQFVSYFIELSREKHGVNPIVSPINKASLSKVLQRRNNNDHVKQILDIFVENKTGYFTGTALHTFCSDGIQDLLDNILRTGKYPNKDAKSTIFKAELTWDATDPNNWDHLTYDEIKRRRKLKNEQSV